ncbi:transposase [Aquibacillus saliphilus]|uniref:transposase n=1 Tax=Aquibacillus saliphilus TaxID=1909422 RepID=UPI001CF0BAB8|nr:transposase [Aquibacillus saliphilus]
MKIFIVLSSIVVPIVMVILQRRWLKFRMVFNFAALLSTLIFGNIASIAIHKIIRDQTVFMTNIHGLFLEPFFLITGAYLGLYLIYIIMLRNLKEYQHN